MKKIIFVMLLILFALCARLTVFAASPQFVTWVDSVYVWSAKDTVYHYVNTGDTLINSGDTTVVTAAILRRISSDWVYIAGSTDSIVSEAFSLPNMSGFPRSSNTWTKPGIIGLENISGTADSMFTRVKLMLACYPGCSGIPDSIYSFTFNGMAVATDSAAGQGISDVSTFDIKAPANCAKLVIYGYGDNATVGDGTKARAWIWLE